MGITIKIQQLKSRSEKQILGSIALQHQVTITGFPLSYQYGKRGITIVAAGYVFGTEKKQEKLSLSMPSPQ